MKKSLRKRIIKVEAQAPQPLWECNGGDKLFDLSVRCIAFHLGNPQPLDSVADAYARALGYENKAEFVNDLESGAPDLIARHADRAGTLLDKYDIRAQDVDELIKGLQRMEAVLPEFYKRPLFANRARRVK